MRPDRCGNGFLPVGRPVPDASDRTVPRLASPTAGQSTVLLLWQDLEKRVVVSEILRGPALSIQADRVMDFLALAGQTHPANPFRSGVGGYRPLLEDSDAFRRGSGSFDDGARGKHVTDCNGSVEGGAAVVPVLEIGDSLPGRPNDGNERLRQARSLAC